MIIKIDWFNGKMAVDAETLIRDIPMEKYKKWVKLFARYGRPEDHEAFLQLLEDQIRDNEQVIKDLEAEVNRFQMMADLQILTYLSVKYCLQQMRLKKKHLNGAKANLKRRLSMCNQLKGLLS